MLNNLTNFFNLIVSKRIKTKLESDDLIAIGTRQSKAVGDYKPTAIKYSELLTQLNSEIGGVNIGPDTNIIYVSPNGDDANTGSVLDPVQTLEQGKNLANSGDLVYVLPGTYFFDNTLANGTPYNGFPEKVNLWKDGVSYYFELGAKVIIWNNTNQENLPLFRPIGDIPNTTCTVRGYLDFEARQFGVSAGNGRFNFFDGNVISGTDLGYTFDAEVNNLKSTQQVFSGRTSISTEPANIIFKFNRCEVTHEIGQGSAGTGSSLDLREVMTNTAKTKVNIIGNYVRYSRIAGIYSTILIRQPENAEINVNIQNLVSDTNVDNSLISLQGNVCKNITFHAEQCYFTRTIIRGLQGSGKIVLTGNYFHKSISAVQASALDLSNSGSEHIVFQGNIELANSCGILASTGVATQLIDIDANINYIDQVNIAVASMPIIRTLNGRINFTGLIKGRLPLILFNPRNGSISVNNTLIYNTNAVENLRIAENVTSTNSKLFLNNSKIQISQNSGATAIILGNRILLNVENSYIVDNSTKVLYFSNQTVANAKLFLLNSTLSSNDEAIDTTGEVVSVNSAAKILTTPPVNLSGVITVEPNLPLE